MGSLRYLHILFLFGIRLFRSFFEMSYIPCFGKQIFGEESGLAQPLHRLPRAIKSFCGEVLKNVC